MTCKVANPDETLCRVEESLREFSFICRCKSAFSLCNLRMPAVLGTAAGAFSARWGNGRREGVGCLRLSFALAGEGAGAFSVRVFFL